MCPRGTALQLFLSQRPTSGNERDVGRSLARWANEDLGAAAPKLWTLAPEV